MTTRERYQSVDLLRGVALLSMLFGHTCYFADLYGVFDYPVGSAPNVIRQRATAGMFFFISGVSMAIAHSRGPRMAKFLRRLAILVGCALVVTTTSVILFPRAPVYFGILHAIALCSLLALPLRRFVRWNLLLGALIILMGATIKTAYFDSAAFNWIGMGRYVPTTLDYQPLFPWLGVVLLGIAAGNILLQRRAPTPPATHVVPRVLAFLGRHTLFIYMAHVPMLIVVMRGLAHQW